MPDHSSLSRTRERLSEGVHESVFAWVLGLCAADGLLTDPKAVAVDSTTLEANAAMKAIVRRDIGADYRVYLRELMRAEGVEDPSEEDVTKFDRKRVGKAVSNADWKSEADPDARIARMKDGTTHPAYKAENVVDVESDLILAAEVYRADEGDTQTYVDSVMAARTHLDRIKLKGEAAGKPLKIEEAVLDKGYHGAETLERAANFSMNTYAAEPERKGSAEPPEAVAGTVSEALTCLNGEGWPGVRAGLRPAEVRCPTTSPAPSIPGTVISYFRVWPSRSSPTNRRFIPQVLPSNNRRSVPAQEHFHSSQRKSLKAPQDI